VTIRNIHESKPFKDWTVKLAKPGVQTETGIVGWSLYLSEGGATWLTSEHCAEPPKPGETARFYGKGFGYIIEGIVIGDRFYR
jgi:hypothetical protein